MPRKNVAETAANVAEENMNVEQNNQEMEAKTQVNEAKKTHAEPLHDTDEVEVVSLVDNVSYKDNYTGDYYEWDRAGHVEIMRVDTIKRLWRNHKRYFRSMWLKPKEDRLINQFGLESMYKKYYFLMDAKNYNRNNMKTILDSISETPNDMKRSIIDKVKSLIINGDITDISVIRSLEKKFDIDLISYLE